MTVLDLTNAVDALASIRAEGLENANRTFEIERAMLVAEDAIKSAERASDYEAHEEAKRRLWTLTKDFRALHLRASEIEQRERATEGLGKQLAASLAAPLLAERCAEVLRLTDELIDKFLDVARVGGLVRGGSMPTGGNFLALVDVGSILRARRLVVDSGGIFHQLEDRDSLNVADLVSLLADESQEREAAE